MQDSESHLWVISEKNLCMNPEEDIDANVWYLVFVSSYVSIRGEIVQYSMVSG